MFHEITKTDVTRHTHPIFRARDFAPFSIDVKFAYHNEPVLLYLLSVGSRPWGQLPSQIEPLSATIRRLRDGTADWHHQPMAPIWRKSMIPTGTSLGRLAAVRLRSVAAARAGS